MSSKLIENLKTKAKALKTDTFALYFAYKDPRTPWYAKVLTIIVVGYAFSPIDLIPDFIPIIGYLDDLILVPAGIFLCLKLIPKDVIDECREKAKQELSKKKPVNKIAAVIIILIWLLVAFLLVRWIIGFII